MTLFSINLFLMNIVIINISRLLKLNEGLACSYQATAYTHALTHVRTRPDILSRVILGSFITFVLTGDDEVTGN